VILIAEEKFHEQIRIENDSTGHCYADIFGRLLDPSVTEVEVDDAYIRCSYQVEFLLVASANFFFIFRY
jgi:hypothetical protein